MKNWKMSRRVFLSTASVAGLTLAACGSGGGNTGGDTGGDAAPASGAVTGTFDMHVQGYDWGAGVDKITLNLDAPLDAVAPENFVVSEHKQATDWTAEGFPVIEADFDRVVTAATVNGNTVELELACDPNNGSPFLYTMATGYNTWCDPYQLNITLAEGAELTSDGNPVTELAIDPNPVIETTSADAWTIGEFSASDGTAYKYAAFDPEGESKTLVVWLHGAGEGGTDHTDPYVTILANKVVALSEDGFQQTVGGAHIVAPQCPTMWMDQGDGSYPGEGTTEVFSKYSESVEEFIDDYATQVGAEKVVLAGCSNGGFMTLNLGLRRPDKYAAIVPICEAINDSWITDDQIAGVKDLPMYFIWSDDDGTVDPTKCEIPTTDRLKAAGASDLHISTSEHVTEKVTMVDGSEVDNEYNGHWSWIYFDNNESECNDDGLKAWEFIAEKVQ